MSDPDEALIDRARAGDRAALEALIERHQARVYRFGVKMCRHPEDARDVLQDTMLALARGVRDFRGGASLSTWLYSVARSHCIKKRRRSVYAPEPERSLDGDAAGDAATLADPSRGPDEEVAGREVERALERAIASLDPMYREVLILRDAEGLTAPEVAEVLGITPQAVKSRLHRARVAVRDVVAPALGAPAEASPGPACPDVLTLFSKHLEDEISADACAEMERHVAGCARCRGACDSLRRTLALCRTSGAASEVPAEVQRSVKLALRGLLAI